MILSFDDYKEVKITSSIAGAQKKLEELRGESIEWLKKALINKK